MGSGKTFWGKRLAQLLNYPFLDMDDLIEDQAEMSISEIFAKEGEDSFRLREQKALHSTLKDEHGVIACGGGTPCFFDNMDWMKAHGFTIYLEVPVEILVMHLLPGRDHRPLIASFSEQELPGFIEEKLSGREPVYQQAEFVYAQKEPFENIAQGLKDQIESRSKE